MGGWFGRLLGSTGRVVEWTVLPHAWRGLDGAALPHRSPNSKQTGPKPGATVREDFSLWQSVTSAGGRAGRWRNCRPRPPPRRRRSAGALPWLAWPRPPPHRARAWPGGSTVPRHRPRPRRTCPRQRTRSRHPGGACTPAPRQEAIGRDSLGTTQAGRPPLHHPHRQSAFTGKPATRTSLTPTDAIMARLTLAILMLALASASVRSWQRGGAGWPVGLLPAPPAPQLER